MFRATKALAVKVSGTIHRFVKPFNPQEMAVRHAVKITAQRVLITSKISALAPIMDALHVE